MKIYPSRHKIKSIPTSKVDTSLNIPLAYIDVDYTKNKISKIVDAKFSSNKKTIIYPEQIFENTDFKIFDKNEEEITEKNGLFHTNGDQYVFYPSTMIKFAPKKFLWKATVKRNFEYNISKNYDIKIGCNYDDSLKENLIKTFMNSSERDLLVHSNIKINSDNTTYSSFTETDDTELDFLFVRSHNCIHYDFENTVKVQLQDLLNNHTNVWFGCEDAVGLNSTYKMNIATETRSFRISNPMVTKECTVASQYYFDLSILTPPIGVTVHNIFDSIAVPVLILEYDGLGFVVITSYTVLDNLLLYEDLMYEVMMYIYTRSYVSTDYVKDWVAYKVPDYEVNNGIYSVKSGFVSKKNIVELLDLEGDYSLVHMEVINDSSVRTLQKSSIAADLDTDGGILSGIVCIGQNGGCPIFAIATTLEGYIEPDKPAGWKSIYYNGYIYYIEKLYYLIEQDITNKIMMAEKDNNLIVKLYSFKSSTYNINKQIDSTIQISCIKTDGELIQRIREAEYTVYYLKEHDKLEYCYAEDFVESEKYYKLFNILIEQSDDAIDIYDMRQLGGGLSEDEEDNFELFDIGHINGRPYRIAGALVLTMPTKYESHDEYIQKAIDKYKTAEDYVAVFYKDEEDD